MKVLTIKDLGDRRLVGPSDTSPGTDEGVEALKPGQFVKIGLAGDTYPTGPVEYCWAEFLKHQDGHVMVKINNDLQCTTIHGVKDEDVLAIKKENVLLILH